MNKELMAEFEKTLAEHGPSARAIAFGIISYDGNVNLKVHGGSGDVCFIERCMHEHLSAMIKDQQLQIPSGIPLFTKKEQTRPDSA